MKLVLLFFCGILILLLMIIGLILLSSIRLNVKKFNISNIECGIKTRLNKKFEIYIEFYLFGMIKIAKIKVSKNLFKRVNIKTDTKSLKKDLDFAKSANLIDILKKLKIKIRSANLNMEFGTESLMLTVYLIAIISTVVRYSIW